MKSITTLLGILFFSVLTFAQTKMVCVSWIEKKTEIREAQLNEYALATIHYTQGDWGYVADVIEGKLNYLTVEYKPLSLSSTSRASAYPLNHLGNALEIDGKQVTVDCDLR